MYESVTLAARARSFCPLAGTVQEVRPARAWDRRLQLIHVLLQFDQRLTDLLH